MEKQKKEEKGEDGDEDISFINELNHKLENSYMTTQTDRSRQSLLKAMKRNSSNVNIDRLSNAKSKLSIKISKKHTPNFKTSLTHQAN